MESVRHLGEVYSRGLDGTMIKKIRTDELPPEFKIEDRKLKDKVKQKEREQLPPMPLRKREVEMFYLSPDMKHAVGVKVPLDGFKATQILEHCLDSRKHGVRDVVALVIEFDDKRLIIGISEFANFIQGKGEQSA